MLNHTVLDYNGKHTEKNGERPCGSTSESSMEAGGEKEHGRPPYGCRGQWVASQGERDTRE